MSSLLALAIASVQCDPAPGADDLGRDGLDAGTPSSAPGGGDDEAGTRGDGDGGTFDAGSFAPGPVDDLLATLPAKSWIELQGSKMSDVCPSPLSSYACRAVQTAWSGGAYDTLRDRMIVYGGGHGDSFYNQLFVFDVGQMTWKRMTEMPSGATPSTPTPEMKYVPIEPCGYYPKAPMTVPAELLNDAGTYIREEECDRPEIEAALDLQQPRSSHTYSKCVYDPKADRFCYLAGNYYPSAQASGHRVQCFSFQTGLWSHTVANTPRPSRGASAVDANGHFWSLPNETGRLYEYDPSTNAWLTHARYSHAGGYLTGDVDRKRHHLMVMSNAGVRRFDLGAPDQEGTLLTTTGDAPTSTGSGGFVYADALDRFVAWTGGADVFMLDPATLAWTRDTGGGAHPGDALGNGTYGRFRYSPLRGVFVLVNGTDENVYLYKP